MKKISEPMKHTSTMTSSQNNETYIGNDGIRYCSKCHTKIETDEILPFLNKRMPIACQCVLDKERKAKEQEEYNKKMQMLERLRSASLLGKRYKNTTFENTDTTISDNFLKAFERCKKYCIESEAALEKGYGIYIYGNSGTGKTHLTACICNELINQYRQCLFTNFFEISKLIRSTWGRNNAEAESIIKKIGEVDFLFIDDLGTEALLKNGEDNWLQEQVFDIVNKRYNNLKPTIFSSNHSLNDLIEKRGMLEKTVDRIGEMSTIYIKVNGTSYRTKKRSQAIFEANMS